MKLAQVSPPLLPIVENTSTPPPVVAPSPETEPGPAPIPSLAQTKSKTAKQLRGEKNRKGKNKAAAAVTKEDILEEQEEVSIPRPPDSRKAELDAAIDSMVHTGNIQSALEQFNMTWR